MLKLPPPRSPGFCFLEALPILVLKKVLDRISLILPEFFVLCHCRKLTSMASSLRGVLVLAALCMLPLSSAQHRQFYRWSSPELEEGDLARRQTPPPGYHPEFGTCGSGTTCENACGGDWLSCKASTDLSLFCYNKVQLNQTCCENGSGRKCGFVEARFALS